MFAQDEKVYVHHEHKDWYLALVEHTYTSTNGTLCVHLYDGTNVPASDVMTYNDYWRRHRDMLALAGRITDEQLITFIDVQKNTISGCWEVRENGHRVSSTVDKLGAIMDAETIRDGLKAKGVEVIVQFDLRG